MFILCYVSVRLSPKILIFSHWRLKSEILLTFAQKWPKIGQNGSKQPKISIKVLKNRRYLNISGKNHKTSSFSTKINSFCGNCSLLETILCYFGAKLQGQIAHFLLIFTIKLIIFLNKSIVCHGNLLIITNLVDTLHKS